MYQGFTHFTKKAEYFQLLFFFVLLSTGLCAQINVGGLKDKLKNKVNDGVTNLANKTTEGIDKKLEKSRSEFDASNFNYAISFSDNSGLFETDEKGSRAGSALKNSKDFLLEKEHSDYDRGYGYNSKGEIFFASNKFGSARNMFKLSDLFYKSADSANSLAYAQLMNNMALLYQSTTRYTKALEAIDKALEIRSKKIPGSAMLAVSVNNKAVLLKDMGRYAEAEQLIDEAISLNKNSGGEKSLGFALALNNKAMLYQATGRLEKAEVLMKQCIEAVKEILTETSSNYIKLKINLAAIYRDMKKYEEAEKVYLEAISIKQKKLGANHPDYAHLKRGLADLYWEMGKTSEVEKNLQTALDIYIRKFGDKNAATTSTKAQLASFYRINGKKEKALEMMNAIIGTDKEIYGEQHPEYIKQLENLAIAQWVNGKTSEATANYQLIIASTTKYIDEYFSSLGESEKTKFWDKTLPRFNRFNSLVAQNGIENKELITLMLNNQLHNKALLLNSSSKIRNQIVNSGDQELINDYSNWLSAKEELGRAYSMNKEQLSEERINIDSLETQADVLEKKLSQKSTLFKEGEGSEKIDYKKVALSLNADEVAVEIIQIPKFDNVFTGDIYYGAIILDNTADPKFILLPNGKDLENQVVPEYRSAIMDMKPENKAYTALWGPIDQKLNGKKKVYVSLDGIYNQVSLLTLKDPTTGKYLIDKESIVIVGNTKDILKLKAPKTASRLKTAYLLGYPNYGGNDLIAALPGTKTEVENINKTLKNAGYKTTVVMQNDATEESVKSAQAEVVHIATHGFFLSDLSEVEAEKVLGVETSKAKKNPLLRSGLMLANCEKVFDETGEKATANNGILTAYEAMNLSLEKTDLVVMSACETGLGDIKSGEGVYGLQRSFLVAGAKSVIMSLWEVSDDATMELMSAFYKNYAASGNKQEAFLAAQKQVKTKYKEPFFWGAFVLIGN